MKRMPEVVLAVISCGVIGLAAARLLGVVRHVDAMALLVPGFTVFALVMLSIIRRRSGGDASSRAQTSDANALPSLSKKQAEAWLAALEAGHLDPPRDPHDRGAWDEYWKNQLKVGALDQGISDQMSSDTALPGLLAGRGARTILCAGNGLSMEAISLALLGFDVTALDISTVPAAVFAALLRDEEHPLHRIASFRLRDDGSVTFDRGDSIDLESYPPMHESADYPVRGGGSLSFATGDLADPEVCPGPYDVVIERRTLQLFPDAERLTALDRLVARLSDRGVFVSEEHRGSWKPGDDRTHYANAWLASRGFVMRPDTVASESGVPARLACLTFSTG